MENKPIINEFYSSKGRTLEETVGMPVEGEFVEEPKRANEPWYQTVIHTFKRVEEKDK